MSDFQMDGPKNDRHYMFSMADSFATGFDG